MWTFYTCSSTQHSTATHTADRKATSTRSIRVQVNDVLSCRNKRHFTVTTYFVPPNHFSPGNNIWQPFFRNFMSFTPDIFNRWNSLQRLVRDVESFKSLLILTTRYFQLITHTGIF